MPVVLTNPRGPRFELGNRELILLVGGRWDGWLAHRVAGRWEVLGFPTAAARDKILATPRGARDAGDEAELIRLIDGRGAAP